MKTIFTDKKSGQKKSYITNVILQTPFFRANSRVKSENLDFADANLRFIKIMNIGI